MNNRRISIPSLGRFLQPTDLRRIPHLFTDVLVIGGGIAGTRAALAVPPTLSVHLITKDSVQFSSSAWAQGGIAGVLDPLDEFAHHVADTMAAGKGLCSRDVVELVVAEAPERIRELIGFGAEFDRIEGELALTLEGGHSHPRIAHALGDATGRELMRAMTDELMARPSIELLQQTFILDLVTVEDQCRGAVIWSRDRGLALIQAQQTILCTGGAGALYRETTNPRIATADGHAAALRAGCILRDMEFMQFHPTVLYIAGSSRHLITEAVRGEGAHLLDCNGHRFMFDYCSDGELAPRDIVSQAITEQMTRTTHPCVYLDLSPVGPARVAHRFPHITRVCADFGLDLATDRVPVRPGAHYMIGGLVTDTDGRTSLPGLWAAGEVTSSGLHGANRLASNSLLEGVVFGLRCGRNAAQAVASQAASPQVIAADPGTPTCETDHGQLDVSDLRSSLSSLMGRDVGIVRTAAGLEAATRQLDFWAGYVCQRVLHNPEGWELQNMMLVARSIAAAALERHESRGVHFRADYPEPVEDQRNHIEICCSQSASN